MDNSADVIFLIISANSSVQGPTIFGLPISSLAPPLAGSFFGVMSGFALNYFYQFYRRNMDKMYYIKILHSEIFKNIQSLRNNPEFTLSIDQWISTRDSGALRLFNVEETVKLCGAYYHTQEFNASGITTRIRRSGHLIDVLEELIRERWLSPQIIKADEAGAYEISR